jgi:hypothetical protein
VKLALPGEAKARAGVEGLERRPRQERNFHQPSAPRRLQLGFENVDRVSRRDEEIAIQPPEVAVD